MILADNNSLKFFISLTFIDLRYQGVYTHDRTEKAPHYFERSTVVTPQRQVVCINSISTLRQILLLIFRHVHKELCDGWLPGLSYLSVRPSVCRS
jgi:hypothetical protein